MMLVHTRHSSQVFDDPHAQHAILTLTIPFEISAGGHAEPSFRTRTFIFFALAALAWRRTGAQSIWIGESGLGCLGPSFVPFGIESGVRGCHPAFVSKLQRLLGTIWGTEPPFQFPHLWLTKAEVIRELSGLGMLKGWQQTHSCSRNSRRQHPKSTASQCGICSGCLFRIESLHAGGLGGQEPPGTYFVDVTRQAEFNSDIDEQPSGADREVATYAVIGMDELASVSKTVTERSDLTVELSDALRAQPDATAASVTRLFQQHASEWETFVEALPADSWIRPLVSIQQGNG